MTLTEILAAALASGDPAEIPAAIPYAGFLGITARLEDDRLLTVMEPREGNIGNPWLPALHGGVVGAFLENAAIFELLWAQQTAHVPKIINITVDYLRPAAPVETFGRATITNLGRRIATIRVEAWQQDPAKPVATANTHFLLTPDS